MKHVGQLVILVQYSNVFIIRNLCFKLILKFQVAKNCHYLTLYRTSIYEYVRIYNIEYAFHY